MKRVLFVCVHNAGRSQMAEGYLNHLAKACGQAVVAESAGTLGGGTLNAVAVERMAADGVPIDHHIPKALTPEMVERADVIVSMGCGVDAEACPATFLVTEDWGLDDPAGQGPETVDRIRAEIRTKCEDLLDRLAAQG